MQENPNWYIIDSSKAKDHLECPRKFWWRHILGWEIDSPNINLIFGEAFHKIPETLLLEGYTIAAIENGMKEFRRIYHATYNPMTDHERAPKNPAYAELAALQYIQEYKNDLQKYEVLHTEISGSVMVVPPEDRRITRLYFKMDSVLKDLDTKMILSHEHKTTGQSFTQQYANQWPMSFQVGTYSHVMRAFYDPETVYGVVINAIGLKKTNFEFRRFPIRKTTPMMEVWYNIAERTLWNIEVDLASFLEEWLDPGLTMESFPPNPQSCDRWYGCPYLDFCSTWANPIEKVWSYLTEPPQGFKISFWDPRAIQTKEVMDL